MAVAQALSALARVVRESGLVPEGSRGVALVSGGADSAALAAGLVEGLGPESVTALHLNYRLRADSDRDEQTCRELCERLGIELEVAAGSRRRQRSGPGARRPLLGGRAA